MDIVLFPLEGVIAIFECQYAGRVWYCVPCVVGGRSCCAGWVAYEVCVLVCDRHQLIKGVCVVTGTIVQSSCKNVCYLLSKL